LTRYRGRPRTCAVEEVTAGEDFAALAPNRPISPAACQLRRKRSLEKPDPKGLGLPLEGNRRLVRERESIVEARQAAYAMWGHRWQVCAKLSLVEHDLMFEAQCADVRGPLFLGGQILVELDHTDLWRRVEAAVVVDQRLDAAPHLHGALGDRQLRKVSAEPAHTATVHSGCVTGDGILLDHDHRQAAHGRLKGRRATMNSSTHDKEVGSAGRVAHPQCLATG
jgi:hypothetical protein